MSDQYGMTTRAVDLLDTIRAHQAQYGSSPTYAQMAQGIGVSSVGTIHRLILQLERRGLVRRIPNRWQSVELIERRTVRLDAMLYARLVSFASLLDMTPDEVVAAELDAILPERPETPASPQFLSPDTVA